MNICKSLKKSNFCFLSILLLIVFMMPGHVKAADSSGRLSIAVIPERADLDFWKLLRKGVASAALADGSVKVFWLSPQGLGSYKEQVRQLEWCTENNVDAVIISPVHAIKMKKYLGSVMNNGIPVIQMVSGISYGKTTGFVHSNNFEGGVLAAKYLEQKENGAGSVVLGLFERGNYPVNRRVDGFKFQLKRSGSKLKIAKSIYVGEERDKGASKIRIAMWAEGVSSKRKKLKAVVGMNESSSETLLATLKKMKKIQGLYFVAFNPDPDMIHDIRDGVVSAAVAQDPYEIGRVALNQAVMAARGQEIPSEVVVPVYLVTKDNLSQTGIQEVLGLKERGK